MSTIWAFGDSFTKHYRTEYIEWKGYEIKQWPELLADKLGYDVVNYGQGGASNYHIFQKICELAYNFEEGDIVIVGWGLVSKFRVIQDNQFFDVHPTDPRPEFTFFQKDRLHVKWAEEVVCWEKMIGALADAKKFTFMSWSFEEPLLGGFTNEGFENINTETNNEVSDNHLSEKGHQDLANYFWTLI